MIGGLLGDSLREGGDGGKTKKTVYLMEKEISLINQKNHLGKGDKEIDFLAKVTNRETERRDASSHRGAGFIILRGAHEGSGTTGNKKKSNL